MASEEQAQAETPAAETPIDLDEKPELNRVVVLTGTGGLNKVEMRRVAKPKPGEDEVLIKIHAR